MRSIMTRWASMLFIILMAVGGSVYAQDQTAPPPPVATVNGKAISQQDFDFEFQQTIGQMAQRGQMIGEENLPVVRQSVLGRMIEEELLFQDTQTQGINIPDQRVSDELARVKTRFPSEAEFQTALTTLKISEDDLRRKIHRGLAIQQLISTLVLDVQVTDAEMQTFYESNPSLFQSPEQIQARHILIKVAPEAEESVKKEALQKIKDVQKKIKAGEGSGCC